MLRRESDTDIDKEILGERPEGSEEVSHRAPRIRAVPEQGRSLPVSNAQHVKMRRESEGRKNRTGVGIAGQIL